MTTSAPKPVRFTFSGESSRLVGSIREIEGALMDQKRAASEQMAEMRRRSREEADQLKKLADARQGSLRDELAAVAKLSSSERQAMVRREDLWTKAARASKDYVEAIKKAEREQRRFKEIGDDTAKELANAEKRARRLARELDRGQEPLRGMRRMAERFGDSMAVAARRAREAIKRDIGQTLKDSLSIPGGALGAVGAGVRGMAGPVGWAASGGWQRFQEGYIEKSESREMNREGWRQAILGSGFSEAQFGEISSFNRSLLKNIPGGEADLYETQRMLAFETGGDTEVLKRLTQIAANIDAVAPKDDMGDIAEDMRAVLTEFEMSPDFWLRVGVSREDFREYEDKFRLMREMGQLERDVAQLRAMPDLSDEGMQSLREKSGKLALARQYEAENVPMQFIEALGKRFEGAAERVAGKIPMSYARGEIGLLESNLGKFFSEWAGDYYSDLGSTISNINDVFDNLDSVSGLLEKTVGMYNQGAFEDEINKVKAMLKEAWDDLKTIFWATLEALGDIFAEGFRIGSLYFEDMLVGVLKRIPILGMGGMKSTLGANREAINADNDAAEALVNKAASGGMGSGNVKIGEAIQDNYIAMKKGGASSEELDAMMQQQAAAYLGFKATAGEDISRFGFGDIGSKWYERSRDALGRTVQKADDIVITPLQAAESALTKARAGYAQFRPPAQGSGQQQAAESGAIPLVYGGAPDPAAAARYSAAMSMARGGNVSGAVGMTEYQRQALAEQRRANAERERRNLRGVEAYD